MEEVRGGSGALSASPPALAPRSLRPPPHTHSSPQLPCPRWRLQRAAKTGKGQKSRRPPFLPLPFSLSAPPTRRRLLGRWVPPPAPPRPHPSQPARAEEEQPEEPPERESCSQGAPGAQEPTAGAGAPAAAPTPSAPQELGSDASASRSSSSSSSFSRRPQRPWPGLRETVKKQSGRPAGGGRGRRRLSTRPSVRPTEATAGEPPGQLSGGKKVGFQVGVDL